MVSRDSAVHAAVVAFATGAVAVLTALGPDLERPAVGVVVFVVFYGLVLGGAHLALAVRGEDGIVPVSSRWRFLGVVDAHHGAARRHYPSSRVADSTSNLTTSGSPARRSGIVSSNSA